MKSILGVTIQKCMQTKMDKQSCHFATKGIQLTTLIMKRCYTCINCNRPQLDKLQVFVGFDRQLYCKTCYPKIWHTPLPLESTSKIKAEPGDCSGCPRCGGKVFEAERMACRSGWYHKLCFSCKICKRLMDYSTFVDYKVRFKSTFVIGNITYKFTCIFCL